MAAITRLIVGDRQHRMRVLLRMTRLGVAICLSSHCALQAQAKDLALDQPAGLPELPAVLKPPISMPDSPGSITNNSPGTAQTTADLSRWNLPVLRQAGQEIFNLHMVTPALLRGGQPSAQGLLLLKNAGVKTVVNLRNEDVVVNQERMQTKNLGLNYVSIPLDLFNRPSDAAIQQFLTVVSDPNNQPVYVHCLQGQDRTGTMCGIYRLTKQGWTFDAAYNEMLAYGFKPVLGQLTQTVVDYSRRGSSDTSRPRRIQDIKNQASSFLLKRF